RIIRYSFSSILLITIIFSNFVSLVPIVYGADQVLTNAQADRARLQAELNRLEQEIAQKQAELTAQKGQSVSLSRDIAILTTQIKKSKLDISAKNLVIKKLGGEITEKNKKIEDLVAKIETEKESLAQLIRKDREIDDKSLVAFVLSQETIFEAYGDIDAFASIKLGIKKSVDEIRGVKTETETERKTLEKKKDEETDVKVQLETAKKQVELNEAQKQQLLSVSKDKEKSYQQVLADKARRRSEILAVLFNLRDASAIPFGKALEYANDASAVSGVTPAFILAIITQESNLGANQGSCYVTNFDTGAGVGSKTGTPFKNVMKPTRDVGPFQDITIALGRDPAKTLVSCPIASAGTSSWGGAMGPAQFIPSTWRGMASKVASALGVKTPDPWNPRDAIMASALFLKELGGVGNSYTAQIKAACKYYGSGGSTCTYGKQVMTKMANIQTKMIDPLQD
ncbi:MAG: lytic murein transglycosylase, partial [Patescibacteria group bacterium]